MSRYHRRNTLTTPRAVPTFTSDQAEGRSTYVELVRVSGVIDHIEHVRARRPNPDTYFRDAGKHRAQAAFFLTNTHDMLRADDTEPDFERNTVYIDFSIWDDTADVETNGVKGCPLPAERNGDWLNHIAPYFRDELGIDLNSPEDVTKMYGKETDWEVVEFIRSYQANKRDANRNVLYVAIDGDGNVTETTEILDENGEKRDPIKVDSVLRQLLPVAIHGLDVTVENAWEKATDLWGDHVGVGILRAEAAADALDNFATAALTEDIIEEFGVVKRAMQTGSFDPYK